MEETRNALRRVARSRREALAPQTWLLWSRLIQAQVVELAEYLSATAVALYSPVQNEVDTRAILDHAFRHQKKVFYPKFGGHDAPAFVRVFSDAELVADRYGIPERADEVCLAEADYADLAIIVPGLVFDCRGYRLGRGGGWYDRMLSGLGPRSSLIGLAFEFQVVDRLPEQSWDQKVHYVITETRIIGCSEARQPEISR